MNQPIDIKKNKQSKIVLGLSVVTLLFVMFFKAINPYKSAAVGAVFEILWLAVVSAVFIIPVMALWALLKKKFSFKSLYFYALVVSVVTILLLFV